ncbi:TetR/AcrR family transcriptional regulator [Actinocorallia sp. A-T 12471]|uniref:TetR/AcrR family transcriptional regulator n=1 Tax=Actinocorallia sp. A-T 12471 TaxID=3089813 RepID=UPI0029D381FD|nr:TetR/AcrR family transcriptional regulator [Actinocorallia sp. A-T 12471]MDX6740840.1 TetR/AcrR family transcriptional regulator [Actinocorallia sp. A-T 12471]
MEGVLAEVVEAAVRAARRLGKDVADVPTRVIAQEAGMSRSTLLRRIGGSRQGLDEAVRAAGIDPGGQRPVRERAVEAGAYLISANGLAGMTLEAVAAAAGCSVHSLYAVFGGRDELLKAIFERYSPIRDAEEIFGGPRADLGDTVRRVYRVLAAALTREPRVMPAMFAEAFARPAAPAVHTLARHLAPRLLAAIGGWLAEEVAAGRLRPMPVPVLAQQMIGPVMMHFLTRPALSALPGVELPDPDAVCAEFADAFLRATALPEPGREA